MSADKKSNQSQIAQATLDEANQSVKVTIVDVDQTIPVDIQDTEIAISLDSASDSVTIYAPNSNTTPIPVSGSVNVSQVGGNAIATGGGNITTGTQRVTLAYDQPPLAVTGSFSATVTSEAALDVLATTVIGKRNNQVELSFDTAPGVTLITNTTSGGASVTHTNGHALYSTGTGVTALAKGVSVQKTEYRPAHEVYSFFTAAFTTPTSASSYQRLGLYDASNGFFIGYEGLTFGITKRTNGVDTFIPASSFNTDLLNGITPSKFTRNGVVEAINYGFSNLFRVRFAWLGSANILFEVFSPDAKWVTFHNIRQPNTDVNPSIYNPDLPMTVEASKTASDATNLTVYTACWAAGTTSELDNLTATLNDNSLAALTRSVITGQTTAGGGGYVNVKVTPSGSLTTAIGDITDIVGQDTMANSIPVVIASNQTAVPVSGTVAATQSGTWNINNVSGTVSLPTGASTLAAQNTGNASLSSIDSKLPTVGQKTSAASQPVVIASDQVVPVTQVAKQTYAAGITNLGGVGAPIATTPTDIVTITGSATKVVKVRKVHISGIATIGAQIDVFLIKRSSANSGGTAVTVNKVPYDSLNAAATATVVYYTANPSTLGGTVNAGTISQSMLYLCPSTVGAASASGPLTSGNYIDIEFKDGDKQPLTLRGTSEVLAINLNGITVPAGTNLEIDIEWTEE
jgi:hypothetical protein